MNPALMLILMRMGPTQVAPVNLQNFSVRAKDIYQAGASAAQVYRNGNAVNGEVFTSGSAVQEATT